MYGVLAAVMAESVELLSVTETKLVVALETSLEEAVPVVVVGTSLGEVVVVVVVVAANVEVDVDIGVEVDVEVDIDDDVLTVVIEDKVETVKAAGGGLL